MHRLGFLVLALMWIAAPVASGQQQASAQAGAANPYLFSRPIPGLTGFRVEETLNPAGDIRGLVIYHDRQPVQTLDTCTGNPVPRTGTLGGVVFSDFNFDRYTDLAMLVSSANGNNSYCVWLFDRQTNRFVLSGPLSRLTNPAPDLATKTIVAYKHEDCGGQCYERETYAWSGDRLAPVKYEAENQDPSLPPTDDCRFIRTVKRAQDGRLVETGRQRVDQGGIPCVPHHF